MSPFPPTLTSSSRPRASTPPPHTHTLQAFAILLSVSMGCVGKGVWLGRDHFDFNLEKMSFYHKTSSVGEHKLFNKLYPDTPSLPFYEGSGPCFSVPL